MIKEEYILKLKKLEEKFNNEKKELYKEYALSNNPYKVGDIIEDHYHVIKIEKIEVHKFLEAFPSCVYKGEVLTKKLIPAKVQKDVYMYQSGIKRKLN
jgi:hypothetical protein